MLPSCYRLTESNALQSIKVVANLHSTLREILISTIASLTNLIESICSPHLQTVSIVLEGLVGEVENFHWEVVNNLAKVSPHSLQRVEIALRLLMETNSGWPTPSELLPGEYEDYFCRVRSVLPELGEKVVVSVAFPKVRHSFRLFSDLITLRLTLPM